MDMFDPEERGGIALPGLFVLDPASNEVLGYRGNDFADRRDVNQRGAFSPKMFGPYFSGNKFGALAIRLRAEGNEAKTLATEHQQMSESMLEAWADVNG
jgi:hypothetical protein